MKTNGDRNNGGSLCGLSGAWCASGDWRRAYADYLVQYTKFYAQEGIDITDLGFTDEPNWTTSYESMRFTPAQAVEFIKTFGPVARNAGLRVACCDVVGWDGQKTYTNAIEADSTARGLVDLHTGHSYGSYPSSPLPTSKPTWMSEWSPSGTTWNENWDDDSGYDGFRVADAIHTALTGGNVNAYVYWFGASTGDRGAVAPARRHRPRDHGESVVAERSTHRRLSMIDASGVFIGCPPGRSWCRPGRYR